MTNETTEQITVLLEWLHEHVGEVAKLEVDLPGGTLYIDGGLIRAARESEDDQLEVELSDVHILIDSSWISEVTRKSDSGAAGVAESVKVWIRDIGPYIEKSSYEFRVHRLKDQSPSEQLIAELERERSRRMFLASENMRLEAEVRREDS
jgi:hypothetical protein